MRERERSMKPSFEGKAVRLLVAGEQVYKVINGDAYVATPTGWTREVSTRYWQHIGGAVKKVLLGEQTNEAVPVDEEELASIEAGMKKCLEKKRFEEEKAKFVSKKCLGFFNQCFKLPVGTLRHLRLYYYEFEEDEKIVLHCGSIAADGVLIADFKVLLTEVSGNLTFEISEDRKFWKRKLDVDMDSISSLKRVELYYDPIHGHFHVGQINVDVEEQLRKNMGKMPGNFPVYAGVLVGTFFLDFKRREWGFL